MTNTIYKFIATITNDEKTITLNVSGEIYESGASQYGNQKGMEIIIDGNSYLYDIRYDTRYDGDDKKFIINHLHEWWNGENGAWKLVSLEEV